MPCHETQSWTFSGLVGAFLDLFIVYLLLCASTLAYSASKFLGLFGLSLPCSCNGIFYDPNSDNFWQTALVDCPSETISSVQFSVKSKFPFDSSWDRNLYQTNSEDRFFGLDEEASTSSLQEKSEVFVGSAVMQARDDKEESFDIKGKGRLSHKIRHDLRRRATDAGRSSSVSSYNPFKWDAQTLHQSPASVSKIVNASNEGSMVPYSSDGNAMKRSFSSMNWQFDGRDSSMEFGLLGRESPDFESNEPANEKKPTEKVASPESDLKLNAKEELHFGPYEKNAIRVLEQALEAEHSARDALYLELEKERSAAATAAEEALAMILRLQEEKASIEMEARQYQRMIEAKSAYDFEEMNIVKEILLRGEREKHFLQKEVEAYRQMMFGSEQLHYDAQDTGTSRGKRASTMQYSDEDPLRMPQKIGECICEKENVDHILALGEELPIPMLNEVFPQEKEIQLQFDLSTAEGYKKTVAPVGEVQQQSDVISTSGTLASEIIQTCDETEHIIPYNSDDSKMHDQDLCKAMLNMDSHIHDVHMIDDKFNTCGEVRGTGSEEMSVNTTVDIPKSFDSPAISSSQTEQDTSKSCSGITSGLPSVDCSLRKPLASAFRRNSMSAVDYERLKIDNEVGRLWERLRVVQEGRGKLNLTMEYREKETIQLQLLEKIVSQLREIQQLRESARQVSLPPPSCQIMSKKRRWQSFSLEVHKST